MKTYEENISELETIVAKLESGNVPLAEMVALYEAGQKLANECQAQLKAFEEKLEVRNGE
ncbi:MAG: exodeoxyribonuclease VII small subunit [Clostridiales bacterium]|nr:exodeoxyribonuclease VII small subunit [Clostridiales bacterium]